METIDLSSYQSFSDVQFRFWMLTDNFIPSDGFYFDDFEISDYDPGILNNNETEALSEVIILPNPFDSSLSILGISEGNATITMYDAQGRKLKFSLESVNNGYFIVGLDALTSGIYFLKIKNTDGEKVVRRIIKE